MKLFNIKFNHSGLYYWGLILTVVSLPLSKFLLSVSMIWLITNWLLEGKFKNKWNLLLNNKPVLVFELVILVHLLWLANTENFSYAFRDLSNKAILLLYPVIMVTSGRLSHKKLKTILTWFATAVITSSLISAFILAGIIGFPFHDIRDISAFMSHIRLSLLVNLSIFILGYMLISKEFSFKKIELVWYTLSIVWLILFLYLLKSFTGIGIFIVTLLITIGIVSFKIKDVVPRLFLQVGLITVLLLTISYLTHSISKFYTRQIVDIENLDTHTQSGNLYEHDIGNDQIENGKYVWLYVCEKELEREWNKVSSNSYSGKDGKDQSQGNTLIRYLTSMGFRKDSAGIAKLSRQDILNIEQGIANHLFTDKYAMYPKIYQVLWQIDVYKKGYNPSGNSITQRIEFFKTGIKIIKDNFWFGVGTGDVQDSFNNQYDKDNSQLPENRRLRAHNQYITFFLTFGFIGFCIILFALSYPVFKCRGFSKLLFVVFLIIVLLSFINEDTLETQIGITFFTFFYTLFLFGDYSDSKLNKKDA